MRTLSSAGLVAICAVFALAGCASGPERSAAPPSPSTATPLRLDETSAGTTVRARVGQPVVLDLHSGYWRHLASSAPDVLRQTVATTPLPAPTCRVIGSGCGTFESGFEALRAGTATVTADRDSCGEAMACAPEQRTFTVTVVVDAS
ncbi:hypothetical protein Lfu02_41610 [Longispora fulva]|uniref:Uncharacterized protein n=1 Tax=Longispora fulva TaxID=619741 RepID=A0A8J7KFU3_9ACTN|nr:protease inhibitor I42 family protein [Longispora fulva]MBG6136620.1 hypothetical protein [Longispora fulva]GIG59789.1 hypothetical protein Lfu02_41610 [Longispora fulva]